MEGSVTARWLLDNSLESPKRVGRAVGLLWADYEERRKAENALGAVDKISPPAKPAAVRQAELEAQRLGDRFHKSRPPSGSRQGQGLDRNRTVWLGPVGLHHHDVLSERAEPLCAGDRDELTERRPKLSAAGTRKLANTAGGVACGTQIGCGH